MTQLEDGLDIKPELFLHSETKPSKQLLDIQRQLGPQKHAFRTVSISDIMRTGRLNWFGHVEKKYDKIRLSLLNILKWKTEHQVVEQG